MKIVYISDFDLKGSGYSTISTRLCTTLSERGHSILALGIAYGGQEHSFPFPVVPVHRMDYYNQIGAMLQALSVDAKHRPDVVVVAIDVPQHIMFINKLQGSGYPYVAIFPKEAPPLTPSWALNLIRASGRLVMSRFGEQMFVDAGVPTKFLPVAIDGESWRPSTPEESMALREAHRVPEGTFVILQVAENQERKNLSAAFEAMSILRQAGVDFQYHLVAKRNTGVGWNLDDLGVSCGIYDRVHIHEKGISFKQLWGLYTIADAFLMTSKAEGLGMPVLEAMACGVPVVAPDHTAFSEHLSDNKGILVRNQFTHKDVFGNEVRYYVDPTALAEALEGIRTNARVPNTTAARAYVLERTPEREADAVEEVLASVEVQAQPSAQPQPQPTPVAG